MFWKKKLLRKIAPPPKYWREMLQKQGRGRGKLWRLVRMTSWWHGMRMVYHHVLILTLTQEHAKTILERNWGAALLFRKTLAQNPNLLEIITILRRRKKKIENLLLLVRACLHGQSNSFSSSEKVEWFVFNVWSLSPVLPILEFGSYGFPRSPGWSD